MSEIKEFLFPLLFFGLSVAGMFFLGELLAKRWVNQPPSDEWWREYQANLQKKYKTTEPR